MPVELVPILPELPEPRMLGRYRLDAVLGQGQTGIVYRAFDTTIERVVAVKRLRSDRTDSELGAAGTQGRIQFLLKEAKVIGQLNHPHIAAVYDIGLIDDAPYIVMEFIEGETLKARIPANPADAATTGQILSFIVMVARALHYVHQRGILHGDIKPANVIITPQGTPKIMDFGVARRSFALRRGRWSLAGEEVVWGTPGYVAPEQLVDSEIDARADVFSLGVVAYEWLTGQRPFWGDNVDATLEAALQGRHEPLSKRGPFSPELSAVIDRALARLPGRRFASADAFADALEICQEHGLHPLDPAVTPPPPLTERKLLAEKNLLFADFTARELSAVLRLSRRERYLAKQTIVREGAGGSAMYVVVRGSVSVRKRSGAGDLELARILPGACFGEMAVISQMPRSASVVALEPTEVIVISGALLRSASPVLSMKLYRNIAAVLSDRLRQLDLHVVKRRPEPPLTPARKSPRTNRRS